jgi:hypothetical protein
MTPPPDDADPYRAPEAPLTTLEEDQAAPVSDKAMQLLVATRWGMKVVAIALIANGALTLVGGLVALSFAPSRVPQAILIGMIALFALIMFLPGLRLLQSAIGITRARRTKEERDVAAALQRHQQFWMLLGCLLLLLGALLYFVFGFLRATVR